MFRAATVAPLVRNVVHRRLLAIFCSIFKICWVLLSFRTVCYDIRDGPCVERTAASGRLKGALRFGPDLPRTSVRSLQACRHDEIPHVSHVVIKVMRRFSRYGKAFYG